MTSRSSIAPLHTLVQTRRGSAMPLPPRLARLFGVLRMQKASTAPRVLSNFVSTLDGVVSLGIKGHEGGGDISGFSAQDRMVMGLLRATADAVILGGASLAADPLHLWTGEAICPELAADYRRLRGALRQDRPALKVVVSGSGKLRLKSGAMAADVGPMLIVTSRAGARVLSGRRWPSGVEVCAVGRRAGPLAAPDILEAVCRAVNPARILLEGGPQLLGSFYASRAVHEQFLTLAPQLAGRTEDDGRISLVMGRLFAPKTPRWATLEEVRRGGNHLFLRYLFDSGRPGA